MSGWDVGSVFVSAQGSEVAAGTGDETFALAGEAAQRRFLEFLRNFRLEEEAYVYREALRRQYLLREYFIEVSVDHLTQFDEPLGNALVENPNDYIPLLEGAAQDAAKLMLPEDLPLDESVPLFQVLLSWSAAALPIRMLESRHVSRLVNVQGIVLAASRTRAKATTLHLLCPSCNSTRLMPVRPGISGVQLPRRCDRPQGPAPVGAECPLDPYVVVTDRSEFNDQQTIKLQETPENVPTGEMPRHLLLSVDRDMVGRAAPGTRVSVLAVYSISLDGGNRKNRERGGVALRQPYLRVVGMSVDGSAGGLGSSTERRGMAWDPEEERGYKDLASDPDCIGKISRSMDPAIFGHEDIKLALACLLFGGARKPTPPTGTRMRGDIHVLLVGDPSTAKSQLLKFVEKVAPIGVYTSGKGSSAAGLTASVVRDPTTREFYLEGGSMVLGDGGVVCIDEFDKMREQDRVAIHEAMEQQTISIAKAGITTVLNARTSILAAANPVGGRYDDMKTATEQMDFQNTILSRFDMIFIVRDVRSEEKDRRIAEHVLDIHTRTRTRGMQQRTETAYESSGDISLPFLRRYIAYCRSKCFPRLSSEAARVLENYFVRVRANMRRKGGDGEISSASSGIPITVRQLEAIVRVSESLAKMSMSRTASEDHVRKAIELFRVSTVDAANSGMLQADEFLTEDQRGEIQRAEVAVLRLVAIGSTIRTRIMSDSLRKQGFSDISVQRSMYALSSRGDIEYLSQKKQFRRKR